jgi:hypothetical protein
MAKDELVSVALIREDLRQLLVASKLYLDMERKATGNPEAGARLELAIDRIGKLG